MLFLLVVGNFIILYGGNVHKHHEKEMEHCYDNQLHVYHYSCNTWVRLEDLEVRKLLFQHDANVLIRSHREIWA